MALLLRWLSTARKSFLIWSHFLKRLEVSAKLGPKTTARLRTHDWLFLLCPRVHSHPVCKSPLQRLPASRLPPTHWPCCESRRLCPTLTAPMFTTILSCDLRGARRSSRKGAWRLNCVKHTGCGIRTREPPPKLDFILNAMRSHWKFQAGQ